MGKCGKERKVFFPSSRLFSRAAHGRAGAAPVLASAGLIARATPDRTAHGDGRRLMGTKRLIYRRAVFISIDKGLQRKICTGKLF